MVLLDSFSKYAHFRMLPTNFSVGKAADLFTYFVCKLHGFPKIIISNRDLIFLSRFWRTLFELHGTKLRISTTYHLQTDSQSKVLKRYLQQYLRALVHEKPSSCGKYVIWVEWHYNTSIYSAIGVTPFQAVYCKPPSSIQTYILGSTNNEATDSTLATREHILQLLRINFIKAQIR